MAENKKPLVTISVAVGSKNPCKVDSVKQALQQVLNQSSKTNVALTVEGFSAPSGVPDQPFGDEETQLGAKNRAQSAYDSYKSKNGRYPDMAVGLEGGLEWSSSILDKNGKPTLWCMAWMAIYGKRSRALVTATSSTDTASFQEDSKPIWGMAKTGSFILPHSLAALINDGMELGDADDKVFARVNSKQGSGTVGVLTDGLIDRAAYYEHALVLALVPWIRPDVYQ